MKEGKVGTRELKNRLSYFLRRVTAGEIIERDASLTRRSGLRATGAIHLASALT